MGVLNRSFLPQLIAAVHRHDETGGNFATEGAVLLACEAVCGDEHAQHELGMSPAWRLDADGSFMEYE